jgi:hypothetical protein
MEKVPGLEYLLLHSVTQSSFVHKYVFFIFLFSPLHPESLNLFIQLVQSKPIGETQFVLVKLFSKDAPQSSDSHVLHFGAR